jgi:hypothetical protein
LKSLFTQQMRPLWIQTAALHYDATLDKLKVTGLNDAIVPLLLEIRKAVICHGAPVWCCNWCCKKKWSKEPAFITRQKKVEFFLSTILRGSSTKSTGCIMFPCLE